MNILYLAHRIPYPPNKGDKIRSFNEIKYLAREHTLHLAFLVDDPRDVAQVEALQEFCAGISYDLINARWQKLKTLPYLLTGKPLSVPYFYSGKLQADVDRILREQKIDLVFCFSSPMAEYVFRSNHYKDGRLGSAKLIMDFVDVDSDKWRMYAGFSSFPLSAVYRREWRSLQAYDSRVGQAFDRSIFVSDKEVELFRTFCPEARTAAVANGVDRDYFAAVEVMRHDMKGKGRRATILFMGAMDYFPNEDAVTYFAQDIWPLVKEKFPHVRFIIAGSNPTKGVKALAQSDQSISVTGFVPDMRPYLAQADVFVAPFRIARGIQNKVLEAMAAGVPVVARPEAVKGFDGQVSSLKVETNAEQFASAIVELLVDEEKRTSLATEAKQFVCSSSCWETNMAALQRLLHEAIT